MIDFVRKCSLPLKYDGYCLQFIQMAKLTESIWRITMVTGLGYRDFVGFSSSMLTTISTESHMSTFPWKDRSQMQGSICLSTSYTVACQFNPTNSSWNIREGHISPHCYHQTCCYKSSRKRSKCILLIWLKDYLIPVQTFPKSSHVDIKVTPNFTRHYV